MDQQALATSLGEALLWFVVMTPVLGALFLALLFLVVLLQVRAPQERVRDVLRRRGPVTQYLAGAGLGAVTPFCSMTTIPVLAGLLRAGAPFGPTMAFLISSPLLDGIVLGVLVFLVGPKLTALYAGLTFLVAIGLGLLFDRLGLESEVRPAGRLMPASGGSNGPANPAPQVGVVAPEIGRTSMKPWARAREAARTAWGAFVPLAPHLLLGTSVGALLRAFLPVGWIVALAGPEQPFAIPLMAALGLPVYINAEILLPVAAALVEKGMGAGAVMALVITGLGMSASEVALLTGFFRARLLVALALSFFAVAVAGGALATVAGR